MKTSNNYHKKDISDCNFQRYKKRPENITHTALCMHVCNKHMRYSLMSAHLNQYLTNPPKGKFGAKPEGIDKI